MVRDKIAEIAAVRGRGKGHRQSRARSECGALKRDWGNGQGALRSAPLFIVIRLVTVLEVFVRSWIAGIVDSGDPYTSRAADIIKGVVKIDFALAQALVGKKLTFGELVAHEISINNIGDIDRVFSQLLDVSIWTQLKGVVDRWEVEILGADPKPIIENLGETKAELANLFNVRHIAVHELPDDHQISISQIDGYLEAVSGFMRAIDQSFSTMLDGDYPLTQLEMNIEAGDKAKLAQSALESILKELDPEGNDQALNDCQKAWELYRKLQATYRSGIDKPGHGSIAPLLYSSEFEDITKKRIDQLRWYIDREEWDL